MSYQSQFRPDLFAGQTIVVTGGGSGIGRCVAHELCALGAQVMLLGRNRARLEAVAGELERAGGRADCFAIDIRDEDRVVAVVGEIVARYGRIHALVNNAGGQYPSPLEDISRKGFEAVLHTNLLGGFLMAREVFRQSLLAHGGSIVNLSADSVNGTPGMAHTGAARAGMENLTRTAAWEWGGYGVRVNAVAPGFVDSSGLASYDPKTRAHFRQCVRSVPLKRMASVAEISAAVCFLLSPGAGFINGATLAVDGGGQFGSSSTYFPLPEVPMRLTEAYDGFGQAAPEDG